MAFCTNCGSSVQTSFCPKCGTPVSQAASVPGAQPPTPAAPAPPARKKTSPIVWILGIVLGLFILVGIAVVGAGIFVVHKVKQAGFDPALMQKNPALAVTKLIAAANPDVEVVSVDDSKGLVTLRDKKSGKVVTLNFDDVKNGRISFQEAGQPKVTMETHGSGDSGTVEFKSDQGSVKLGGGTAVKIPDWVPSYPGSSPEGTFSMQGKDGESGSFRFVTKDSIKNVMSFYENNLKQGGFSITSSTTSDNGGMLMAQNDSAKRNVMVTVDVTDGQTGVNVVFGNK